MTATLEQLDWQQPAPVDSDVVARIIEATSPAGAVEVACTDVRREGAGLVLELEVRVPVARPVLHGIPGFHADVTGA